MIVLRHLFSTARSVLLLIFLMGCVTVSASAQAFIYEKVNHNLPSVAFGDASFADVDGDGHLDVFISGLPRDDSDSPDVFTYLGLTPEQLDVNRPVFELRTLPATAWSTENAWTDYDHDGRLDVLINGISTRHFPYMSTAAMYAGTGGGLEQIPSDSFPSVHSGTTSWVDVDNDGDEDLFLTGVDAAGDFRAVLYRNENGALRETSTNLPAIAYGDAAWGDYDNDGDMDVLLTGAASDGAYTTVLYRNDAGTFEPAAMDFPGLHFSSAAWGDYDGDGDLDLALNGGRFGLYFYQGRTYIFENEGDGVFSEIDAPVTDVYHGDITWGDYDNDGDLDLIISGAGGFGEISVTEVFENLNGTFEKRAVLAGVRGSSIARGDADGDGDLDLIITGERNNTLSMTALYRNNVAVVNTPPSAPQGLRAEVAAGAVTLAWEPAQDSLTAAPTLTYALRVGASPGGSEIMTPDADLQTGRRLLPRRGNAGHGTTHHLNLPVGTYYWSVQAIDASYVGSGWANEGAFTITEAGKATDSEEPPEPLRFALHAPFPNPSKGKVTIGYTLPGPTRATIILYDVLGRKVRVLENGPRTPGRYETHWDGRTADGPLAASGVYFCRLSTESGFSQIRSILLVR